MTKLVKILLSVVATSFFMFLTSSYAQAVSVDVPNYLPQGEVQLDDHDKVVSASAEVLKKTPATTDQKWSLFDLVSNVSLAAVNLPNGRWVYYSDHHNYFNGYKWGHSNYLNRVYDHYATAKIFPGKTIDSFQSIFASKGSWSYATAKGYGTFYAYYSNGN